MSRELTNLLPVIRARLFKRLYFLRLATVTLALLTSVVVLHGLMLLPSYLYARGEVERGRESLAAIDAASLTAEEQEARSRADRLRTAAQYLTRLDTAPVASAALRAVLTVPREGIALTGFTFMAGAAPNAHRMDVSGVAASRDALRRYVSALDALPFVDTAALPISSYARESSIPFTISLTGTLRP